MHKITGSALLFLASMTLAHAQPDSLVKIDNANGSYAILSQQNATPLLHAQIAVQIDHHWIHATDYPIHRIETNNNHVTIMHTGLANAPDLICSMDIAANKMTMQVQVKNNQKKSLTVQTVRLLESTDFNMGKHLRVLSDSFSEDRPTLQIRDLDTAPNNVHRAVGSQLFYNRDNKESLFIGALTSNRFLTIMHLHVTPDQAAFPYEIDSTGLTEISKEYCLKREPAKNQIELSLPLQPGTSLYSERVEFSVSSDYHAQLENYGNEIKTLHHARVTAATPIGWWSWTAFYRDITQQRTLNNASVLAKNLLPYGYNYFQIDEGYQSARGDYTIPDLTHFPDGLKAMGTNISHLGLTLGIWTAPFEASEKSLVFQQHPDWFVHNAQGEPINIGYVDQDDIHSEKLYALDPTHPGVQDYLKQTYSTITRQWGARFLKLDFMDDSSIEGYHYLPNITALEAQRIGMQVIRDAVGQDVLLDKDGSPMLNMVGMVDTGRISVDTGHSFSHTKDSAVGIAARYYMNRNFFIADPDAFTVSRFRFGSEEPLTLEEAKASIALSAVSGGMFEIGDDLALLNEQPERLALLKNKDLIEMARNGIAAKPVDLMDYRDEDLQPSIFLLTQDDGHSVLTVFNWTDEPRVHEFHFAGDVDLYEVMDGGKIIVKGVREFSVRQGGHTVRMIRIVKPD